MKWEFHKFFEGKLRFIGGPKQEKSAPDNENSKEPKAEPAANPSEESEKKFLAPITYKRITKLTALNNRNMEPLIYESDNDYGLTWKYIWEDDKTKSLAIVQIRQNLDHYGKKFTILAQLFDYSITKIERQETTFTPSLIDLI